MFDARGRAGTGAILLREDGGTGGDIQATVTDDCAGEFFLPDRQTEGNLYEEREREMLSYQGNGNPIPSSLLPHEFTHDLPPEEHHGVRTVPGHQNRQLLHVPTAVRSWDPRRHDGR